MAGWHARHSLPGSLVEAATHALLIRQLVALTAWVQVPVVQRSIVQARPSAVQAVVLLFGDLPQFQVVAPVDVQTARLHSSAWALQSGGAPGVQVPLWQVSPWVQPLLSALQAVAFGL